MNIAISFHQIFGLLQNWSVIQKSNKNSGFNLFSLFHHKLTKTFCNNMSSIKREVRGKDSYILEFWKCSCRQSSSHEFWCHPSFCKKYKDGNTHSSLSSTRPWPIVTDIRAKVLLLPVVLWWAKVAFKSQLSSPVTGLSLCSLQLGCAVSRTWQAAPTRVLEQSWAPLNARKRDSAEFNLSNWSQLGNKQHCSAQSNISTSPQPSK